MIHQYKLGGYIIVLDVCSGAVHVVDDIAYDLIAGYESKTRGELISEIAEKYCGTECGSTADAVTISDFNGISEFTGDLSDNPVENGICVSPYYTMKVNGAEVPVYAARSANGIHSFAYLDVKSGEADGSFSLDVELSPTDLSTVLDDSSPEGVVLPERNGVAAEIEGETVRATID